MHFQYKNCKILLSNFIKIKYLFKSKLYVHKLIFMYNTRLKVNDFDKILFLSQSSQKK